MLKYGETFDTTKYVETNNLSLNKNFSNVLNYSGIGGVSKYLNVNNDPNTVGSSTSRTIIYELTTDDKNNGIIVRGHSVANCGSHTGSDISNNGIYIYLI